MVDRRESTVGQRAPRVVVVDRNSWYLPVIEQEALSRVGAQVEVSWAGVANRPPQADVEAPADPAEREFVSRITGAFVPPSITTEDKVIEMAKGAEGMLVVRANISAKVMDALPRLKVIGRYGIGVDNIDTDAADARGIAIVNAPGFCAREVADHTMSLLLACSRKVMPLHIAMTRNVWGRDMASPMRGLYTRTLGLVGFGQIAKEVAKRAQAFGISVIAHDPFQSVEAARELGVSLVTLDDLLSHADFVSLHAPLTAQTHHLIGARELERMKGPAYLINTSRGPLIDEVALADALARKVIAGAALDVFETEPLPVESPLRQHDNLLMTPHVSGLSNEGQMVLRQSIASAMADVLAGTWPTGPELFAPRDDAGRARAEARFAAIAAQSQPTST